ncbi:MAG: hypothetical protein HY074_10355, partial [Deltaproteobacteria bacterium]|nr:hypothetical protein [Deltaproteobacteria bacterium]
MLFDKFTQDRKREAPNSWETDISHARTYVIPYFLNEAKSNSIVIWSDHYDEFREWLGKVQPIKCRRGAKRTLSLSTQNMCIKALNNFLNFMMRKERMEAQWRAQMERGFGSGDEESEEKLNEGQMTKTPAATSFPEL